MNFKKFAKSMCLVLALVFMMASSALAVNTTDFIDFPNDWSTPAMEYAVENGLIKGYEDNTIRANQNITRAEMGAIVNRAFGSFVEAVNFPYLDVEDIDWFYSDMRKAVNMGTMQGSDNMLRPDDAITREEAFVVIARAYSQKDSDFSVLDQYPDNGDINEWSKDYLSFLTRNDYVNGFDDGNLYPQANLTRAELSQLIFNMIAEYVNSQSALDSKDTYDGNIVINGGISEINGKTFKGDLVIGDGVGVNQIVIKNTKIAGALVVRGTTQIKLTDTTVGNRIIVNNPNNNVHFDNYKSENVFKNVETQTSATWKQGTATGGGGGGGAGGGGGGSTTYYTVTYYVNNTSWATESVPSGGLAPEKTYYDKPGYTLSSSWYTTSGLSQLYNFATPVTGNLNLYATASANKYTVTFNANGGTVGTAEKEVTYDQTYGTLPVPEKTGYTFEGWFIGTEEIKATTAVKITSDSTAVAKWTPKTYTLSFDEKGGNSVQDITVTYNAEIGTLPVPAKTGYTFTEWTIDGVKITAETVYTFTENKTAVADYTANKYTLTFKDRADEIEVTYDNVYPTLPAAPEVQGQTFVSWVIEGTDTQIIEGNPVKITDNAHLVPIYTEKDVYVVTFDANGGIGTTTQRIVEGEKAQAPEEPTREGYNFDGWFKDIEGKQLYDFDTKITADTTVYAKWTIKTYTVTFKDWNGDVLDTQTVNHGATVIYGGDNPSRDADNTYTYTFEGWDKPLVNITEDTTITAQYTNTYIDYTVKFVAEGTTVETLVKHYGDVISVAQFPTVPAKTGYTGVWNVTSDITVSASTEVNAIYTANTYKLTFEGLTNEITVTYDNVYPTLPNGPEVYGKTFVGWFDKYGHQIKENNVVKITEDTHLKPEYTEKDTFDVTFDANGGTFNETLGITVETQTIIDGEKAERPLAEPTREGYTFVDWYKNTEGTQLYDFDTKITADTTVYAKWKINQYTYTFFDEDGTTVLKELTVDYGTTIVAPTDPTKTADAQYTYTFKEWDGYTEGMKVTGDVTFKAVYEAKVNKYKVTWINEDGTVLETDAEVEYGTVPTYDGATPTKTATAEFTYTFSGWTPAVTAVTGEVTYTATYAETKNKYKVTWINEDGTVLETDAEVEYGTVPTYDGATPEKAATAEFTYTFSGWTPAVTAVTGEVTYTATYAETKNKYKVTWINEDGTVLETDAEVEYGTVPTYDGATPTKTATAEYKYTFSGWTPTVVAVTGEVTYTATYAETKNEYTITFVFEGNEVGKITKEYGQTVAISEFPTIENKVGFTGEWNVKTDITVTGDVTVTGEYKGNPYKVHYDKNDPEATGTMDSSDHVYGTASDLAPLGFQKVGHTFRGWSKTPGGQFEVGDKGTVVELTTDKEITLYAMWEKNSYNIIYHNEKRMKSTSTQYYNQVVILRTANSMYFEKTGYKFLGWDIEPHGEDLKGEKVFYTDGYTADDFMNLYPDVVNNSGGEVHLYAVWEPITYKVRFVDEWNPTLNPAYEQTFTYDVEANLLENQHIRTGWVVTKWIGTDGTEYEPEQLVKNLTSTDGKVIELKANWMPITYTVVYEGNGADTTSTPVPESEHKYDEPKNLNNNTYTKEGYTFLGWRMKVVENPTTFSMRRLLRASIGDTYENGQEVTNLTDIQGARVILEAIWEANKYFVEYDKNNADATGEMQNSEHYYDKEQALSLNGYTLTGYTFGGWAETSKGTAKYVDGADVLNLTSEKDGTVTLYATWIENGYTVKFDGNGAISGTMSDMPLKYTEEKALTTNGFERKGYAFKGWDTNPAGKKVVYSDKASISKLTAENNGVVTLYAVWEAETYELTFNVNGGKALELTTELENLEYYEVAGGIAVKVTYDSTYPKLPTAEYADNTMYFAGWKLGDQPISTGGKVEITEDSTLVAEWTNELVHEVRFNHYNEDGTALYATVINKTAIEKPTKDPAKTGYTFTFWSLDEKDGSAYNFSTIIEYTDKQIINLYPYFTPNIYKVVYDGNGAEIGNMNPAFYIYDVEKPLDKNLYTRTGYKFLGWSTDKEATVATYADEKSVKNLIDKGEVTLYAVWEANEYTLSFDTAGGNTIASKTVTYDSAIGELETPVRDGYTFTGWTIDEKPVDETTKYEFAEDKTAKATWKANTYKLTFDVNGGNDLVLTDELKNAGYDEESGTIFVEVTYNEQYPLMPTPEHTDNKMKFAGWKNGTDTIIKDNYVDIVDKNGAEIVLTAEWTEKTIHTVIFKYYTTLPDGTTEDKEDIVIDGEKITKPKDPTKTGYTFNFWSLRDGGGEYKFDDAIVSETEITVYLYPYFTPNIYTVKYDGNGAEGFMTPSTHYYDVEQRLAYNSFVKTGNKFLGWSRDKNAETPEFVYDENNECKVLNLTAENNDVVTLYAIWQPNTYYVQYDKNDANAIGTMDTTSHKYGVASPLALNKFEKTGYTFVEWYKDETKKYKDGQQVTDLTSQDGAVVTLYAVWEANTYTIKYHGNGNTSGSTQASTHIYDENVTLTKNGFVKTGYNFMGWDTDPAGEKVKYVDEKTDISNLTAEPNGVINLYAVWAPITYTVKFVDDFDETLLKDGDTLCADYIQTFTYDEEQVLMSSQHEHAGYHVLGWTDDIGGVIAEYLNPDYVNTEKTEDVAKTKIKNLTTVDGTEIIFYTVWQNNNYYVAYDGNGADQGTMDDSEHLYDIPSNLDKNEYKKTGYDTFLGWNRVPEQSTFSGRSRLLMASTKPEFKDGEEIFNLTEILGETVDIIAVWQPNVYYVQYNKGDDDAKGTMSNSEHYYDTASELSSNNFTLDGYSFNGWRSEDGLKKYADKETVSNLTATNNAVVNLYATWEENSYTVKFNGNGATSGEMSDMTYRYSEEKALAENKFDRVGYKFLGWSRNSGATEAEFEDKEVVSKLTAVKDGVVTLYAVWEAETYELTFNVNGGKALELTTELENLEYYEVAGGIAVKVTYDSTYPTLPTPEWPENSEKPMYFVGWKLNGQDMPADNKVKITTDTKLVAEWTDELVHKVIFNKYNEDGTAYETTVINKTAITEPQDDPKKTGYTFDYWSLDEKDGTAYDFAQIIDYTSVQTINLYPYWIANEYTVKYDGKGAEGTMENSTHTYDVEKALNTNAYKKDGYTFMGWDTDPLGEKVVYENGEKVKNLASENGATVTLYAVWAENAYTVIYDGNGAEGFMTPSTHYYDVEKALTANAFEKEGYNFLGWSLDKDATVATYEDQEVVKNLTTETEITLYAIWEAKALKLTFDVNGGEELVIEELGADYYVDAETGKITVDVVYGGQYPVLPVAKYSEGVMSFGGWSLDGNIIADGDTVNITEDTELVAVWTDKHIVVFHGYLNDGADSLITYVEDGQSAVKPEDPAHSMFTFGGWYADEACTEGNEYDFTTIINKVNDKYQTIHIYPKWLVKVTFYYGPEAIEREKQAELLVAYNTVIEETDIPADRVAYGYWKDGTVSDVYIGEEYEHKIEFKWHEAVGEKFVEFDLTQPITENLDLFNVARTVDIYISSSFDAIDGATVGAIYTSEEALYENILDVIFANQNLAGTVYDNIGQKQKVFDKLISLGIIDENMNILNQARFLKFSLMGEERLERFVYENVEKELTVDAKESISSYLNHLIEKNDGSAESFIKELIDSLLTGEGKEEMKGILGDMLTEMVDLEKEEFIKYVNKYIDDAIAEDNTEKVEDLIHPQIEKFLTEAIAKDFVREMTPEQLTNFVNIYVGTLTEPELKAEVRDYIGDLDETEIIAEVVEYVDNLSKEDVKAEITTYINSLTPEQLNSEITTYVNGMDTDELSEAIVEYINTLSPDDLKAEIKTYIDGLGNDKKAEEVTSYVLNMGDTEFKTEINSYIIGLDDLKFKEELKEYLENNPDEYEELIREAVEDIPDDEPISNLDEYFDDVINYVMTTEGKKDEVTEKAVDYIVTGKRADYENKIIEKVTSNFDNYLDRIVEKAIESNRNGYISDTAYALAEGENREAYTQSAINTIISDEELKATYTTKTIDNIVGGDKKTEYVTRAVERILKGDDRDTYINNTIEKIFTDDKQQTYIDNAVAKIVDKTPDDYSEIDGHIEEMFETAEKKEKLVNYINEQFIENHDFREAILPDAIDMIFADEESKSETVSTIVDFVLNDEDALAEVTDIAIEDLIEDAEFREHTIDRIADYLEHHPEIMEEVVEFAKESELGVFVDEFVDELVKYNQFKVHPDNLFVAEAIERALASYDYDSFMDTYIPERFAGLIPDSILKPIYDNAFNGFSTQLHNAIEEAKLGNTAYVDSGVTVKFNPIADILVPVFNKYLAFKDKAEDKLEGNNGIVGGIYDHYYDENKYLKALVDIISIENFLNGDKSQATETLSGYSLKEFTDYYQIVRNATALLTDAGKWYVDNLSQEKAEAAQEKLAQKVTEYFNSILALVNTYAETDELPSYKDVLEIFEGDIPDRFFAKYESALSKVETRVDIDDKLETVYNKLAEKGIVSKFNTVLDKFIASKFNRELSEEKVPLVYTIVRRALGYDDFYTVDTVFNLMSQYLSRFKVTEDLYEAGNSKLKITIERSYK